MYYNTAYVVTAYIKTYCSQWYALFVVIVITIHCC